MDMEYLPIILIGLASYLLGSISFGRIVARIVDPDIDIENVEMEISGAKEGYRLQSIGGNTVSMKLGARGGCTVGLLDILKVFIPTLAIRLLYPDQSYHLLAALAGFAGHCWPIYYRFKGGRGISAFYGGLLAIDPIGALVVAFLAQLIGMLILKELLFVYAGGVVILLPWMLLTKSNWAYWVYAILINVLFITAMIPEIRQIITLRKKYGKGDMAIAMEKFPMGRQMIRLMNRFGIKM
jgi:glycerol-3-phosphate acyltransferase PlsY